MYGNERAVGKAIADSGLPRHDIFVTTKLNNDAHGYANALRAFDESRERLGFDYIDLYLIHWPLPARDQYLESWRALIKLHEDNLARAIGVSNFHQPHLRRIIDETDVVPAVNQIELHPYFAQPDVQKADAENGILTQAWSPIGGITSYRGTRTSTFDDPQIGEIAEAHRKTSAQVMIRWHLQEGRSAIPKSVHPGRIIENFDVFDFELTPDELALIDRLDTGVRGGPEPTAVTLETFGRTIPEA
jgi:diketogulonate reductase-like aldo/keto reductase